MKARQASQSEICSRDPLEAQEQASIAVLSSMAPRLILEELIPEFFNEYGIDVRYSAMGGVKAGEQIRSGLATDIVVLSRHAALQLAASKHLMADVIDIALSEVVVAVKSDHIALDLSNESELKNIVMSAKTIGLSTGPSGDAIKTLFKTWGISQATEDKIICPPPGTPVGSLIALGEAEIGFQQRSELIHITGLNILGPLPDPIQIQTTFSVGIRKGTHKLTEAKQFLAFLNSPLADEAKIRQGMLPV